ncbi:MAG TPA: hypothetical protein VK587_05010 [bacterium]|nr:hypothetical protein [bacterium]
MRRKHVFYVLLAAATFGLSEFLAAWRAWRAAPTLDAAAAVVALAVGLVAVMLWLGFLLYEVDRAAGRIRRPVGLYEWVLARRAPDRPAGWTGGGAAGHGGGRGTA